MKKILNLLFDIAKYSLIWIFALGIITIFIVPFYDYLINTMGGWIYLIYIILGILTKAWFSLDKLNK